MLKLNNGIKSALAAVGALAVLFVVFHALSCETSGIPGLGGSVCRCHGVQINMTSKDAVGGAEYLCLGWHENDSKLHILDK